MRGKPDGPAPLVLTLALDASSQRRFDAERRAHFPVGRTAVGAHVTLFHALPDEHEGEVRGAVSAVAGARYPVRVAGLRSLGRGVAYALTSDRLDAQHAALAGQLRPWLTRQDAQPFQAHVTIQNKVEPQQARALLARLSETFAPWEAVAVGLSLWRYVGGPWEPVTTVAFTAQ